MRTAVLALVCALLAGCSATRVVYNQLDWVVVWYLNGFFSLHEAQEAQLREAVQNNLEWHRTTQLGRYAQFARRVHGDLDGEITREMLDGYYQAAIGFYDAALMRALPDVSAFFLALDQEQIDEFLENLDEHNEELWEEWAGETQEERAERREKQAIRGMKRVFGRLNGEQKKLIRAHAGRLHDVSAVWMESRRQWQVDFHALMSDRPQEPEFTRRLTILLLDPNREDPADYRELVAENRETMFAMTLAMIDSLSDRQRERLRQRLLRFARDFEILAAQQV